MCVRGATSNWPSVSVRLNYTIACKNILIVPKGLEIEPTLSSWIRKNSLAFSVKFRRKEHVRAEFCIIWGVKVYIRGRATHIMSKINNILLERTVTRHEPAIFDFPPNIVRYTRKNSKSALLPDWNRLNCGQIFSGAPNYTNILTLWDANAKEKLRIRRENGKFPVIRVTQHVFHCMIMSNTQESIQVYSQTTNIPKWIDLFKIYCTTTCSISSTKQIPHQTASILFSHVDGFYCAQMGRHCEGTELTRKEPDLNEKG